MYAGTEAVVYLAFVRQVALLFLLIFLLGGCQLTFHYKKLSTHENQQLDFDNVVSKITIYAYKGLMNQEDQKFNLPMIFLIYIFFIVMAQAQLYLFKNKILEVNSKYINKHDPAKKKKPFKKVIKSLEEGKTNMDDFITQDEIQK